MLFISGFDLTLRVGRRCYTGRLRWVAPREGGRVGSYVNGRHYHRPRVCATIGSWSIDAVDIS